MPCVRKSTVLTAVTAAVSSIYSSSGSVATPSAETSLSSTAVGVATGTPTPASSTPVSLATSSSVAASSTLAASVASSSSSASAAAAAEATSTAATATSGKTTYAGVNIAGFDFGCSTDGTCTVSGITIPSTGAAQMQHFSDADNLNIYRLTVGWQYLTNSVVGGDLDESNFANYDSLMTNCLATGAKCLIDIHNYARWDGEIIGQGGPTNDEFAALWTSLATLYANNTNVIFGIMNEPHDLTVSTWVDTVQAVVTAIRAVAPDNTILMPGSTWSHASALPTEAGPALLDVTNPDGSTDNLLFDVHQYLDSDGSGTSTECVTNNIDSAFSPLATWLRENKRQAVLSETGGGNTASCELYLCQQLAYLNNNTDVFAGYIGWAAGAFDSSYALTLTPTGTEASDMVDTALMTACIAR